MGKACLRQVTFIMQDDVMAVKKFRTFVLKDVGSRFCGTAGLRPAPVFHDENFSFRIVKNESAQHQNHISFPGFSFRIAKI
ncbi:hypothetical protein [Herbaspirillum robiniae]|uniref:hypothetical protein n=1 Tax=Herbaspirillum robiniae TaxID=2014887 RepID=UPI00101AE789|nr:hypothetical protein [Herbaspirillum robiniae]